MSQARLTLNVEYREGDSHKVIERILNRAAEFMEDNGLLSDEDGEIESLECTHNVIVEDRIEAEALELTDLDSGTDYKLAGPFAWVTVGNLSVLISQSDFQCLHIIVYPEGDEMADELARITVPYNA